MALTFSVGNVISKGLGGRKIREGTITLDATYTNGTGYTIAPADLNLKTKIQRLVLGNALGFMMVVTTSTNNKILRCYKGAASGSTIFIECATNESGLNTLVIEFMAIGY